MPEDYESGINLSTIPGVEAVSEIEIPIFILCRAGDKKPIAGWVRAADAELACHPIHENALEDGAWTITHRKTGLRISPSRTYCKDDALALIDAFTPLTDWSAIEAGFADASPLQRDVESAYEQFVPPSALSPPQSSGGNDV